MEWAKPTPSKGYPFFLTPILTRNTDVGRGEAALFFLCLSLGVFVIYVNGREAATGLSISYRALCRFAPSF